MNWYFFVYIGLRGSIITMLKSGKRKDRIRNTELEVLEEKKNLSDIKKKFSNVQRIQNYYKINIYPISIKKSP